MSVNIFTVTFHNFPDRSSWPCGTGAGTLDGDVREGMDGDGGGLRADGWGGDRGRQSMVLCSMSPRDATCLLPSSVTPCPAAPRQHKQQRCGAEDGLNVP